jgi:hypothetical protein
MAAALGVPPKIAEETVPSLEQRNWAKGNMGD